MCKNTHFPQIDIRGEASFLRFITEMGITVICQAAESHHHVTECDKS